MIKIVDRLDYLKYRGDDALTYIIHTVIGDLLDELGLSVYEIKNIQVNQGDHNLRTGDAVKIDWQDPANIDEYNDAVEDEDFDAQTKVLEKVAISDLVSVSGLLKEVQIKSQALEQQNKELYGLLNLADPDSARQFIFSDDLKTSDNIDLGNTNGQYIEGVIRVKNKELIMKIRSIDLVPQTGSIYQFQIVVHGRAIEYNVGVKIAVLNTQYNEQQLYDINGDPQGEVLFSSNASISDIMRIVAPATSFILEVRYTPHDIVAEDPVTGLAFLSSYLLLFNKSVPV